MPGQLQHFECECLYVPAVRHCGSIRNVIGSGFQELINHTINLGRRHKRTISSEAYHNIKTIFLSSLIVSVKNVMFTPYEDFLVETAFGRVGGCDDHLIHESCPVSPVHQVVEDRAAHNLL